MAPFVMEHSFVCRGGVIFFSELLMQKTSPCCSRTLDVAPTLEEPAMLILQTKIMVSARSQGHFWGQQTTAKRGLEEVCVLCVLYPNHIVTSSRCKNHPGPVIFCLVCQGKRESNTINQGSLYYQHKQCTFIREFPQN